MSKRIIYTRYAIALVAILAPLGVIGGNFMAIFSVSLARLFPVPSFCVHPNCVFFLADSTLWQMLALGVVGAICLMYFLATALSRRGGARARVDAKAKAETQADAKAEVQADTKAETQIDAQAEAKAGGVSLAAQHALILLGFYCLYIQALRIVLAFPLLQYDARWWAPLISRIAIFSFTLHACSFFVVSLWMIVDRAAGRASLLAMGIIVSFAVAYLIPLDRHLLTDQLIHQLGYFEQLRIFIVIVNVITAINYLKYCIDTGDRRALWLLGAYIPHAFVMHALFLPLDVWLLGGVIAAFGVAAALMSRYALWRGRALS